jgi:cysteinyl-tRNA synthetase
MALKRAGLTSDEVQNLIDTRTAARMAKDFKAADAVRLQLADVGVMIMDTPTGTTWRPGVRDVFD